MSDSETEWEWLGKKTSDHCSVTQLAYELRCLYRINSMRRKMTVVLPVDRPDHCAYLHHMFTNPIPALVLHAMIAVVEDLKRGCMSTIYGLVVTQLVHYPTSTVSVGGGEQSIQLLFSSLGTITPLLLYTCLQATALSTILQFLILLVELVMSV